MSKKILFLIVCLSFEIIGASNRDVAEVEIIKNEDSFYIKDELNNQIGKFKIMLIKNATRNPDSSISFIVKLYDIDFGDEIYFEGQRLDTQNDGKIAVINIGHDQLKNEIFTVKIRFTSNNPSLVFEKVNLRIKPIVFIKSRTKEVNFGKLTSVLGKKIPQVEKIVKFQYSILADSKSTIYSENNFRLKHTELEQYISYDIKCNNKIADIEEEKMKILELKSNKEELIMIFTLPELIKIPIYGTYKDKVTITLIAN